MSGVTNGGDIEISDLGGGAKGDESCIATTTTGAGNTKGSTKGEVGVGRCGGDIAGEDGSTLTTTTTDGLKEDAVRTRAGPRVEISGANGE